MAQYHVKTKQGVELLVNAPDHLSPQEVSDYVEQELQKSGPAKPGIAQSAIQGGFQGGTMNFGDEIASAANAVLPLDKLVNPNIRSAYESKGANFWEKLKSAYNTNMALEKQSREAAQAEHPTAYGVGSVGGGVATVLGPGGVVKGIGEAAAAAAPRAAVKAAEKVAANKVVNNVVTRSAAAGAGYGTVAGAGAGDPGHRQQSAAMGGITGAALGAVVGPLIQAGLPTVAKYYTTLIGKNATPEALAQANASLKRADYDLTKDSDKIALEKQLRSFGGKPVTLADLGSATRARVGVGLRTPNEAQDASREAVYARQRGTGKRLEADIKATVAPRTDVTDLDEALIKQRAEEALPLKQAALNEANRPPPAVTMDGQLRSGLDTGTAVTKSGQELVRHVPDDQMLQDIARLEPGQKALEEARAIADAERNLLNVQRKPTDHLPDFPQKGAPLDMKALDYMKQHLDREVDRLFRSGQTADAMSLKTYRDALRQRMRDVSPEYGQYLDTYSDISASRDALAAGGTFDRLPPEKIVREQADRATGDQELYRVGAARRLTDIVKDTNNTGTANPAKRILSDDTDVERLNALGLEPGKSEDLQRSVHQERELGKLTEQLQGSGTDERLAARADAEGGSNARGPFNIFSSLGWASAGLRAVRGAASLKHNAAVNEALLPRMLEQDPAAIARNVSELQTAGRLAEAKLLQRAAQAKFGSKFGGVVIGAPVSIQDMDQ